MRYIEDFREDERVMEHYLCKTKQSLKSKSGKTYYSLTLQDKTGTINAKVWDLNNDIRNFEQNDFIKIDGVVLSYQNELQLKVTRIRKSNEGEYEPNDYIPATSKDVESLYKTLCGYIDSINNKYIKGLMTEIFITDDFISKAVKTHSAAKTMHHGYLGGLIEHTVSVVETCDFLSNRYKFVNRDLLLASAMLHDIGKVYELSPFPTNDYTDVGQLLGHIVICVELITEKASKIEKFPKDLINLLKHSVISHHGSLEYGSPKLPSTMEAFILSHADELDAKVKMLEEHFEKNNTKDVWTGYNKVLTRNLRKTEINE